MAPYADASVHPQSHGRVVRESESRRRQPLRVDQRRVVTSARGARTDRSRRPTSCNVLLAALIRSWEVTSKRCRRKRHPFAALAARCEAPDRLSGSGASHVWLSRAVGRSGTCRARSAAPRCRRSRRRGRSVRSVSGRMTVPVPTDPSWERPSGRQTSIEMPYISCSTESPGPVKASGTRSSMTSTVPPGFTIRRAERRTPTGSGRSWMHSNAATRS